MNVPFDIERMIEKLVIQVPQGHLEGLDLIMLVDQVKRKKKQDIKGYYWPKTEEEPAKIELAVDVIFFGKPKIVFYLPVVARYLLADVLYYEIGLHYQRIAPGASQKARQNFAEGYKNLMLQKSFFGWRLFMLPLSPMIYLLNKIIQTKNAK
ncbi:MAG: hypothetical protein WC539_06450 [Nitrospirota bacterium]